MQCIFKKMTYKQKHTIMNDKSKKKTFFYGQNLNVSDTIKIILFIMRFLIKNSLYLTFTPIYKLNYFYEKFNHTTYSTKI